MEELHVEIRAMAEGDKSVVFALAEEVLKPLADAAGHPELFHEDEFIDLMERAEVWIADTPHDPPEVAGYVITEAGEGCLTVRCLCVSPAFEECRVDHRLLDWAEGLAYHRGLERLTAPTTGGDERARELYLDHDYAPSAADDRPDAIVMVKRLR